MSDIFRDSIEAVKEKWRKTSDRANVQAIMFSNDLLAEYEKRLEADPPVRVWVRRYDDYSPSISMTESDGTFSMWQDLPVEGFTDIAPDLPPNKSREYMLIPVEESDE